MLKIRLVNRGYSIMPGNEKKNILTLPEELSIETVSGVMKEIKRLDRDRRLEVDCSPLQSMDSAGISLFNFLKSDFSDVTFHRLDARFEGMLSMFPSSAPEPEPRPQGITGRLRLKRIATYSMDVGMEALGNKVVRARDNFREFFVLLADEIFYTFQFLLRGRGVYPGETWNQLFFMAYKSYPIVSLITFLVGLTVSLTSAEQLHNFGADIYLADLVGFGMIREMVPLMAGIILAGKVGASITAEIASMKVLEETDALKTMGVVPEKFLMVPRLLAMTMAVPLLVAIGDFVGIIGGMLVGKFFSGLPPRVFFNEMLTIVGITDFFIGLGKTMVFGWIVVISAGFKGFTVDRSPTGVGVATTESVVLSISLIIGADCIFALLLY